MNATDVKPGDTVIGRPIGQKRRQRIHVTQVVPIDGGPVIVLGLLCSAKYPGDFRGQANLFADAIEEVVRTETA